MSSTITSTNPGRKKEIRSTHRWYCVLRTFFGEICWVFCGGRYLGGGWYLRSSGKYLRSGGRYLCSGLICADCRSLIAGACLSHDEAGLKAQTVNNWFCNTIKFKISSLTKKIKDREKNLDYKFLCSSGEKYMFSWWEPYQIWPVLRVITGKSLS